MDQALSLQEALSISGWHMGRGVRLSFETGEVWWERSNTLTHTCVFGDTRSLRSRVNKLVVVQPP